MTKNFFITHEGLKLPKTVAGGKDYIAKKIQNYNELHLYFELNLKETKH